MTTTGHKAGDIILVHTQKGFVPKGIRYFTKCYYNHAAIVIKAMGELCVLEAIGRGFMITQTLEEYIKESPGKRNIAFYRPKEHIGISSVNDRLKDIIGHPYDYKSLLVSQLIKQVSKKDKWEGPENARAMKNIYCSEACAYAYPTIFPEWWSVAPSDIFESDKLELIYKNH